MDLVAKELEEKRQAEAQVVVDSPFCWKVMGGAWCMQHHGVPYDSFRATYRLPAGREMLHRYGFNMSCTFALSKFGEPMAKCLAEYWMAKMAFFFLVWDSHGRGPYEFSSADLAGFEEPPAFLAAYEQASEIQQQRMRELRALKPGKPV